MNKFRSEIIKNNLERIFEQINQVATSVRRKPEEIKVIVVTKGQPLEVVNAAIQAGAKMLGENYVEEGIDKISRTTNITSIEWHMIGHIQSRKAAHVVDYFHYIHSVDSVKLALRLSKYAVASKKKIPVLLECNTSGEESKFGFPTWDESTLENFFKTFEEISALPNLKLCGLMTIAPFFSNPQNSRPYFKRLMEIRDRLAQKYSSTNLLDLSMGMSSDFIPAIEEGATFLRIGQAILGPRPQ